MKSAILFCAAGLALGAQGYNPAEGTVTVTVDPSVERGAIRAVNGVNNGPCTPMASQNMGYYEKTFADAKIPFARTHDSSFVEAYGVEHVVDVSALFPNFDADEAKAENYDFNCTDAYLKGLIAAGTEPYFRLGQRIELQRGGKKYHLRPKDFAKWARICEHVIAHYTEGWAGGYRWNIRYWEIWNEPDNNAADDPECWQGTDEEFYGFFVIAQTHLKKRFPNLRIGGPGLAGGGRDRWTKGFFEYLKDRNVKLDLDFYSWHTYTTDPRAIMKNARMNRAIFDAYGYTNTESHVTEWNYVKGFNLGWDYTLRVEQGDLQDKGAAFIAASITEMQDAPVDVATFYDAAPSVMNSLYDRLYNPIRGYYPFFAWGKLRDLGTQVAATVVAKSAAKKDAADDMYVTAAKGPDGRIGILVTRYNDDNNVIYCKQVNIRLAKGSLAGARSFLTDRNTLFTERPCHERADGSLWLLMEPNSFVWIESGAGTSK